MATGVVQAIVDKQPWIDELSDMIQPLINNAFSSTGQAGMSGKLKAIWNSSPFPK